MTSQFKSLLKFVANAAVVVVVVAFAVPAVYRAVQKAPGTQASPATALVSTAIVPLGEQQVVILTFNGDLPAPQGASDICNLSGPRANTCYDPYEGGIMYFDKSLNDGGGGWVTGVTLARGGEATTVLGLTGEQVLNNAQALIAIDATTPVAGVNGDSFAIMKRNLAGVQGLVGFYTVGCGAGGPAPACTPVANIGSGVYSLNGADLDDTDFGLNGKDFTVGWTKKTESAPTGFSAMKLYLVPVAVRLVVQDGDVVVAECEVGCTVQEKASFFDYNVTSKTFEFNVTTDSGGGALNGETIYNVCLFIDAATDTLDCTPPFRVGAESGADVVDAEAPFIQHIPVISYITGGAMTVYAVIDDDQTAPGSIAAVMKWGTSAGEVTTTATGAIQAGTRNLFKFETTSPQTGSLYYYLKATDGGNQVRYFTKDPDFDMGDGATENGAATRAFQVSAVAAGSFTVGGNVTSGGSPIPNSAFVFLGGLGKAGVTTSNGSYSITNVPEGNYDIISGKDGYCEAKFTEYIFENRNNINLSLNEGDCFLRVDEGGGPGGGDGGGGTPFKQFSSPPEWDNFAPIDQPIRVGFSADMNSSTINDNSTSTSDNVYLVNAANENVAGSTVYCANTSAPGCDGEGIPEGDQRFILFTPNANLTPNTFYTLVITSGVTSENGQSVEGGRDGGGLELSFTTGGSSVNSFNDIANNFGTGGAYMPPFVESATPSCGNSIPPNGKVLIRFNTAMKSDTINTNNIKLFNSSNQPVTTTVSLDSNERKTVTVTPSSNLVAGSYTIKVLGAVAKADGVPMRDTTQFGAQDAFKSEFTVAGSVDATPPEIFPAYADDATGIPINIGTLEYGLNEQVNPSTVSTTNISMRNGSNDVAINVEYDPGANSIRVIPKNILRNSVTYTVTFGTGLTDLNGVALASAQSFTFTTAATLDTTAPKLADARCDDSSCYVCFNEPMNNDSPAGSNYTNSVLNPANYTITYGTVDITGNTVSLTGKAVDYDPVENCATIGGLTLGDNNNFRVTAGTNLKDLSGRNAIQADARVFDAQVEDSAETYGSFGDSGMFGPPKAAFFEGGEGEGGQGPGGALDMGQVGCFGSFSVDDIRDGNAVEAFPFNPTAGLDSNIFQIRVPMSQFGNAAVADGNLFTFTFPRGTDITNAKPDTLSPFYRDMNEEWGGGTVTFDATYDSDGVQVDTAARTVTVKVDVAAGDTAPSVNDNLVFDLRGIENPSIPKGPESGGYTVEVKVTRSGTATSSVTSRPYFINEGGTNSLTVSITTDSVDKSGDDGDLFVFAGGPAGEMGRKVTLTNGVITQVDDAVASTIAYTNLNDGCYFVGTESNITLGENDFSGKDRPEPTCLSGGGTVEKTITLTRASGSSTVVPVTVKLSKTGGFGGADIDIFAGGPGRSVVKTLNDVTTPDADGYTLNLPANGFWRIGVGPAMPKGSGGGKPDMTAFGGNPPPPAELEVAGLPSNGLITNGSFNRTGASFNGDTDTLTFTVQTANKAVPVRVVNGANSGIANVEVFIHGKEGGDFGTTDKNGLVTLNVSDDDNAPYEIGARKNGLGSTSGELRLKNENNATTIYVGNTLVQTVTLKIAESAYTISGNVLDGSNKPVANAPLVAEASGKRPVFGMTESDGTYSLGVDAGTWTIKAMLPPDKTDACGTFSKTVTVTTDNKANEQIKPTTSTCLTVGGTVTVDGTAQSNVHIDIMEWDTVNDRPSGGFFRGADTNSSGVYSAELLAGTYRFQLFHPQIGELSTTATVSSDGQTVNISSGTRANVTFSFTGGAAEMNGFIELKKTTDRRTGFGQPINGTDEALVISVPEGSYNYRIDLFGSGQFTGTVATGSTATIDLSSFALVTLSGTVYDDSGQPLPNAKVSIDNGNGIHMDADTDENGDYEFSVTPGRYMITAAAEGHVPGEAPEIVTVGASGTEGYDFGGDAGDQLGLVEADDTIEGTLYESDGTTPMTDGFVWAENSDGLVVSAPVDPTDASYTLPVTNDTTWTVKAAAPLHAVTTLASTVNTVDATADTGKDITLTEDATRIPKSASQQISISTGGTLDDSNNSGVKMVAGAGVLKSSTSASTGNVQVEVEMNFTAPESDDSAPVGNVSYDINLTDPNDTAIKEVAGNIELDLPYDESDLPEGTDEADLIAQYIDPAIGDYAKCEGGSTVDTENNIVKCVTTHTTTFVVTYPTVSTTVASSNAGGSRSATVSVESGHGSAPTVDSVNTSANTTLSVASPNAIRTTITAGGVLYRPLQIEAGLIEIKDGAKTVALTGKNAELTLQPSETATVKVTFAPGTSITATPEWKGDILPPTVQPKSVIKEDSDYEVEGDRKTLSASDVETVVHVGSASSPLTLSAPATLKVPVNLADGDIVEVYSSEDGALWERIGTEGVYVVAGGQVSFASEHFTYFAVVATGTTVSQPALKPASKTIPVVEIPFVDLRNHWSSEFVSKLYGLNIIAGKTAKRFRPDDTITRAELAKIAVLAFGYDVPATVTTKPFLDVEKSAWYAPYVQAVKQKGVIKGYSNGRFRPEANVNRVEALKILLEAAGVEVSAPDSVSFKDVSRNAWYFKYVAFAKENDLISAFEKRLFRPALNLTRAEAAKAVVRILELE